MRQWIMERLSGETVRLVSSSQVITSVYTVVKELVENSLDAEATNVEIKLENFGRDLIEVRDNGIGINQKHIPDLARPHFTSKLSKFEDLTLLTTYGFRGEALSSIAAVADLIVTTCTRGDDVATTYTFDHLGEVMTSKPSHLGWGTTVSITNLFRNIPVRKQYFRSAKCCKEDLRKVEEVLLAYAIAHPGVRFVLKHNKNVIWQKVQTMCRKVNVTLVLGSSAMQQLTPITFQSFDPMLKVNGLVPKPGGDVTQVSRTAGDRLFVLVNQRPVMVKPVIQLFRKAFLEAFPSESSRFPVGVLCVEVPPSSLDVNLEPNKTSVLFQNMEFVLATLSRLLADVYSLPWDTPAGERPVPPKPVLEQIELNESDMQEHEPTEPSVQQSEADTQQTGPVSPPLRPQAPVSSYFQKKDSTGESATSVRAASQLWNDEQSVGTDKHHQLVDPSSGDYMEEPAVPVSNGNARHSADEPTGSNACTSVTRDLTLEPESYELLDITDLEETIEEFERFSDEEDGMLEGGRCSGGKDDSGGGSGGDGRVGGERDGLSVSQPALKQVTLAGWSRGEALRESDGRPIEPVKLLKPINETVSTTKPPSSKLVYKGPPPVFDMINSRPVKRKASSLAEGVGQDNTAKRKKTSPETSPSATSLLDRWRLKRKEDNQEAHTVTEQEVPSEELVFNFSRVEQRSRAIDSGQLLARSTNNDRIVGNCGPPGCWIVIVDKKLACFNAARFKSCEAAQSTEFHDELEIQDVANLLATATADKSNYITDCPDIFCIICSLAAED